MSLNPDQWERDQWGDRNLVQAYHHCPRHRVCRFPCPLESVSPHFAPTPFVTVHSSQLPCAPPAIQHLAKEMALRHWYYQPLSSTTILSKLSLISARTSLSKFSFMVRPQLVCCKNRCRRPHFMFLISGNEEVMCSVTRCEPRGRRGNVRACWL